MIFRNLILFLVCLPGLAYADSLKGHILDPQGKRVGDAQVRLFDRKTGALRKTQSVAEGEYSFIGIAAGDYLIEAESSSSALKASREVTVSGDEKLDVELAISASSVEVIVTA